MVSAPLKIGDLARETNTKIVTIRYYEKVGLLPAPDRSMRNYRTYERGTVERLRFIRRCRALGFSLDQVRDLLILSSDGEQPCDAVDRISAEHLAEVERKIADLRNISASCQGGGTVSDCRIIDAISPAA